MTKQEKFDKYKQLVHGAINHFFGHERKVNFLYKRFGITYEDMAQIGFLALWRVVDKIEEGNSPSTYIYRCVHNDIRFYIKKHGSLLKMPYGNFDQVWSSFENKMNDDETFESLLAENDENYSRIENEIFFQEVMSILNDKEKHLLNERLKGKSHGDIAEALNLTRQAIQGREQRMREKIIRKMVG